MLALIAGTGFYDWEALQNQQHIDYQHRPAPPTQPLAPIIRHKSQYATNAHSQKNKVCHICFFTINPIINPRFATDHYFLLEAH